MNEKIDEGDLIKVYKFQINPDTETALSLEKKSQEHMFHLFKDIINQLANNIPLQRVKQPMDKGLYIDRKQFEEMRFISLEDDSNEMIERKIRAFWYPPYEGAAIRVKDREYTLVTREILRNIGKLIH